VRGGRRGSGWRHASGLGRISFEHHTPVRSTAEQPHCADSFRPHVFGMFGISAHASLVCENALPPSPPRDYE
jgi:hypothetical protein